MMALVRLSEELLLLWMSRETGREMETAKVVVGY